MGKITFYTDVFNSSTPFIRIEEGDFKGKIFLIDTGSSNNMLFDSTYQQMKGSLALEDGTIQQIGIEGNYREISHLESGNITICGRDFGMVFLIVEDKIAKALEEDLGFAVCGIIGTPFMAEHDWKIDFAKQEITFPDYCF